MEFIIALFWFGLWISLALLVVSLVVAIFGTALGLFGAFVVSIIDKLRGK